MNETRKCQSVVPPGPCDAFGDVHEKTSELLDVVGKANDAVTVVLDIGQAGGDRPSERIRNKRVIDRSINRCGHLELANEDDAVVRRGEFMVDVVAESLSDSLLCDPADQRRDIRGRRMIAGHPTVHSHPVDRDHRLHATRQSCEGFMDTLDDRYEGGGAGVSTK